MQIGCKRKVCSKNKVQTPTTDYVLISNDNYCNSQQTMKKEANDKKYLHVALPIPAEKHNFLCLQGRRCSGDNYVASISTSGYTYLFDQRKC